VGNPHPAAWFPADSTSTGFSASHSSKCGKPPLSAIDIPGSQFIAPLVRLELPRLALLGLRRLLSVRKVLGATQCVGDKLLFSGIPPDQVRYSIWIPGSRKVIFANR